MLTAPLPIAPPGGYGRGLRCKLPFKRSPVRSTPSLRVPPKVLVDPPPDADGVLAIFFQHKKLTQTVGPPDSPPPGGVGTWVGGGVLPVLKESLSLFGKMDTSNTDMDIYMCAHAYERACVACVRACVRSWRARVCDS